MIRVILPGLVIFISSLSFAQKDPKWNVSFSVIPLYSNFFNVEHISQKPYQFRMGYSADFMIHRNFNKRITLEWGMKFSSLGYRVKTQTLEFYNSPFPHFNIYFDHVEEFRSACSYKNLSLPVAFRYFPVKKKSVSWSIAPGFAPNLCLHIRMVDYLKRSYENTWDRHSYKFNDDVYVNIFISLNTKVGFRLKRCELGISLEATMSAFGLEHPFRGSYFYTAGAGLHLMFDCVEKKANQNEDKK